MNSPYSAALIGVRWVCYYGAAGLHLFHTWCISLSFNQSYKIARPVGELKFMCLLYMISMHMSSAFRSFNQAQGIEEAV